MRFAGNNLACANCHIDAGTRAFGLSLVGVSAKFPQPRAGGGTETLAERINGCMTRSMNGRALPEAGPEMTALLAYMAELTADAGSFGDPAEEPRRIPELDRPADPVRGGLLYAAECAACHRADGSGMRNGQPGDALGYLHPPLWGPDSFNDAAGMGRLITAANFVHDNMPPGTSEAVPTLPPEVAWDIAAFVESQPRPALAGLDSEYADPLDKPVDAAYPPYLPGIAPEQYRYGPFQPIRDRIAELKAAAH
jgi:thiosulfate dehydrogenase